jgi:hypothetical protein
VRHAVAGSEDQPDIGFEVRVPGFELEGTQFQDQILARWANDMRLMDWSQYRTTCEVGAYPDCRFTYSKS